MPTDQRIDFDSKPTHVELIRLFIAERLEKVPKESMDQREKKGRLSELTMLQVIAGNPTGETVGSESRRIADMFKRRT